MKGLLIEHVDKDIRAVRISVRRSVDRANAAYFFTISETRTCDFFFQAGNGRPQRVAKAFPVRPRILAGSSTNSYRTAL